MVKLTAIGFIDGHGKVAPLPPNGAPIPKLSPLQAQPQKLASLKSLHVAKSKGIHFDDSADDPKLDEDVGLQKQPTMSAQGQGKGDAPKFRIVSAPSVSVAGTDMPPADGPKKPRVLRPNRVRERLAKMNRRQKWCLALIIIFCISVVVGVALGIGLQVVLGKKKGTGSTTTQQVMPSNGWTDDSWLNKALSDEAALTQLYNNWRSTFGIADSAETYANFKANVARVVAWNAANNGSTLGVNKYSGLSSAQFAAALTPGLTNVTATLPTPSKTPQEPPRLNWILGQPTDYRRLRKLLQYSAVVNSLYNDIPQSMDWRTLSGLTTPVVDQGMCGSSWALAGASIIESATMIRFRNVTQSDFSVSSEAILQCASSGFDTRFHSQGCAKGSVVDALNLASYFNVPSTDTYGATYSAASGTCNTAKMNLTYEDNVVGFAPDSFVVGQAGSAWNLFLLVYRYPVVVYLTASPAFQLYKGGIFDDPGCNQTQVNYAVVVLGFNRVSSTPYWIIQSSFGTSWGENGYMRLAMYPSGSSGACNMYLYQYGPPTSFTMWPPTAGLPPQVTTTNTTQTTTATSQPTVPDSPAPGSDPSCMIPASDDTWSGYILQSNLGYWKCAIYWRLEPGQLANAAVTFQLCRKTTSSLLPLDTSTTCKLDPYATNLTTTSAYGTSFWMFSRCNNITADYEVCPSVIPEGLTAGPIREVSLSTAPELPDFNNYAQNINGTCPSTLPSDGPGDPELDCVYAKINAYRAAHGVPPVTWSTTLAGQVDTFLQMSEFCPGNVNSTTVTGNLVNAVGFASFSGAVESWYNAGVNKYDFDRRVYDWGTYAFAAIVFKNVTEVGCGYRSDCALLGGSVTNQFACAFGPRFTFGTDMVGNVLPLARR